MEKKAEGELTGLLAIGGLPTRKRKTREKNMLSVRRIPFANQSVVLIKTHGKSFDPPHQGLGGLSASGNTTSFNVSVADRMCLSMAWAAPSALPSSKGRTIARCSGTSSARE
jgi:hypothetical protein